MSFRHDAQACRAIVALLEASELPRLRGLWGPSGPTSEAVERWIAEHGSGRGGPRRV